MRGGGRIVEQLSKLLRDAGHLERLIRELDLMSFGTVLEWERVCFLGQLWCIELRIRPVLGWERVCIFPNDHRLLANAIKLRICRGHVG